MKRRLKRSAIKRKVPAISLGSLKYNYPKLNAYALAYTLAIISGVWMLILSLAGKAGYWLEAVEMMQNMHLFYSLSISGIIIGIAETALCGLIFGFVFGWIYNKLR